MQFTSVESVFFFFFFFLDFLFHFNLTASGCVLSENLGQFFRQLSNLIRPHTDGPRQRSMVNFLRKHLKTKTANYF